MEYISEAFVRGLIINTIQVFGAFFILLLACYIIWVVPQFFEKSNNSSRFITFFGSKIMKKFRLSGLYLLTSIIGVTVPLLMFIYRSYHITSINFLSSVKIGSSLDILLRDETLLSHPLDVIASDYLLETTKLLHYLLERLTFSFAFMIIVAAFYVAYLILYHNYSGFTYVPVYYFLNIIMGLPYIYTNIIVSTPIQTYE